MSRNQKVVEDGYNDPVTRIKNAAKEVRRRRRDKGTLCRLEANYNNHSPVDAMHRSIDESLASSAKTFVKEFRDATEQLQAVDICNAIGV